MRKAFLAAIMFALGAQAANATDYSFTTLYDGTTASVAPGTIDPRTVTLMTGDSFTYVLQATQGSWSTRTIGGGYFPAFAVSGSFGDSFVDYALTLGDGSSTVFSAAETNLENCCEHLGTNYLTYPGGLSFTQFTLAVTIHSLGQAAAIDSLLPFTDTPQAYSRGVILYTAGEPVPEPATWALTIAGFGAIGAALRRGRTVALAG